MTAYSFKKRFVAPILSGRKSQTIRAVGKRRHARPDQLVQLYTGMRTRQCELIMESRCVTVLPVAIDWRAGLIDVAGFPEMDLDDFARRDGFVDLDEMAAFWRAEHPGVLEFSGFLIQWRAPPQVVEMGTRLAT